jgi:hypothetical protein
VLCAILLLLPFVLRMRERFAAGSIEPTCPEGTLLVGQICRADGVFPENGQCPEGTTMNEEGMCQRQEQPICPADYTLKLDDIQAMCEPTVPIEEPTDEQKNAALVVEETDDSPRPICPAGSVIDQWNRCRYADVEPSTRCPAGHRYINRWCESPGNPPEYTPPICPEGKVYEQSLAACIRPWFAPTCPSYYELSGSLTSRFTCKETPFVEPPPPPPPPVEVKPPAPPTVAEPPKKAPPRKQDVLGPTGKSGETIVGADSYTTNKYPQLLGGQGSLSTRIEGAGITSPSKNWLLVADGSLPSSESLGSDEKSKYFPFSRVATTLEAATDPSKLSRWFGAMSPFLTDFSAFFR